MKTIYVLLKDKGAATITSSDMGFIGHSIYLNFRLLICCDESWNRARGTIICLFYAKIKERRIELGNHFNDLTQERSYHLYIGIYLFTHTIFLFTIQFCPFLRSRFYMLKWYFNGFECWCSAMRNLWNCCRPTSWSIFICERFSSFCWHFSLCDIDWWHCHCQWHTTILSNANSWRWHLCVNILKIIIICLHRIASHILSSASTSLPEMRSLVCWRGTHWYLCTNCDGTAHVDWTANVAD